MFRCCSYIHGSILLSFLFSCVEFGLNGVLLHTANRQFAGRVALDRVWAAIPSDERFVTGPCREGKMEKALELEVS